MERLRDVHRISTLMSSLNSMTFSEFFYDLFKSSMTEGKLSLLKKCSKLSILGHFWPNSGQQTQTLISTKMRAIRAVFAWKKQPTPSMISPRGNDKRNELRNSMMITRHYPDLSSDSDWLKQISHAAWPIRSTTDPDLGIYVVTRHRNGISTLVSQTSFCGKIVVVSRTVGCFPRVALSKPLN